MAMKLPHPALGIIIPSFLIAFIGYNAHYFVFRHYFSFEKQVFFEFCMTLIWISYFVAIKKDPGTSPKSYKPREGQWERWCKKCEAFKPERAHHCKACKKCVLKMDHHCPWTANCVGYSNMPHFMRFLYWVIITTGFVLIELFKRGAEFYEQRNYPAYMFRKSELIFTIILIPLDGFILLTITLLTIKCLVHITSGMSQIETWEWERIESQIYSERFWMRIRKNYQQLHGKPMPKLTSIRLKNYPYYNDQVKSNLDHFLFSIDDIVFPYDLGFWDNVVDQLNYPWFWLVPWVGPKGDGVNFATSDLLEEDQLSLPWPPDGGYQAIPELGFSDIADRSGPNIHKTTFASGKPKKHYDNDNEDDGIDEDSDDALLKSEAYMVKGSRLDLPRDQWVNDMGENLTDYGVDMEVEQDQLPTIKE